MRSGGDKSQSIDIAQKFFCGAAHVKDDAWLNNPAVKPAMQASEPACFARAESEVGDAYDSLTTDWQRDNFERYINYGANQAYVGCPSVSAGAGALLSCMAGYKDGTSPITWKPNSAGYPARMSFFDMADGNPNWIDTAAALVSKGVGADLSSFIKIPADLQAFIDGIKGDYPVIAREAARLFYEALTQVAPMKQFSAVTQISTDVISHVEQIMQLIDPSVPATIESANDAMLKAFIFDVDASSFDVDFGEIPAATVDKANLGVTDDVNSTLTIVMRHLFVDALNVYRKAPGSAAALTNDRDVILDALGEKLAVAAKAEKKTTVKELWMHLARKIVKSVEVDAAVKPTSVTFADATMGVPRNLISGIGHKSYLMTSALKFIWDQTVAKEPKAGKPGEFQDKAIDSLVGQLAGKGPYKIVLNRVTAVDTTTGAVTLEPISTDVVGGASSSKHAFTDLSSDLALGMYIHLAKDYLGKVGDKPADAAVAKQIGDDARAVFEDKHPGDPDAAAKEFFGSTDGGGLLPSWLNLSGGLGLGYLGSSADNGGINLNGFLSVTAHHAMKSGETTHDIGVRVVGAAGTEPPNISAVDDASSSISMMDVGSGGTYAVIDGLSAFYNLKHPLGDDWAFGMGLAAGITQMKMPNSNRGGYFIAYDRLNSRSKLLFKPTFDFGLKDKLSIKAGAAIGTSVCSLGYDASVQNPDGSVGGSKVVCEGFDVDAGLDLSVNLLGWADTGSHKLWLQGAVSYGAGLSDTEAYQQSLLIGSASLGYESDHFKAGLGYIYHGKSYKGVEVEETTRHNIGLDLAGMFLPTGEGDAQFNQLTLGLGYSYSNVSGAMSLLGDIVPEAGDTSGGLLDIVGESNDGLVAPRFDYTHGYVAHGIKIGAFWNFMKGIKLGITNETILSGSHEEAANASWSNTTMGVFEFDL
jgi:hypothetical protein